MNGKCVVRTKHEKTAHQIIRRVLQITIRMIFSQLFYFSALS